jgi:hypothetical protein
VNTFVAHHRLAALQDSKFQDWRLGCDPADERRIIAQADAPVWLAALASVGGGLADLGDECPDAELLDAVRHGMLCFHSGIVSQEQLLAEGNAVMRELCEFGESMERAIASQN